MQVRPAPKTAEANLFRDTRSLCLLNRLNLLSRQSLHFLLGLRRRCFHISHFFCVNFVKS